MQNSRDYLQGLWDQQNGVAHQMGQSADYDDGFAFAYAMEQQETHRTLESENEH